MKSLLSVVGLATFCLSGAALGQSVISGMAYAKDGDSLRVGEKEVRLFGIDAPELDQACQRDGHSWPCGAEAANKLSALVTGKSVRCEQIGTDQYGRMLARCTVGSTDVNKAMVALGLAVAYRRYSSDYIAIEESAKGNHLGLWSGQFEMPSEYRHAERQGAQRPRHTRSGATKAKSRDWAARAKSNCNIKGNRNRKGQWIYHLPGMPYYDQTRPEEIFCTEEEAQAAGYRRAIVR
jgi:endonuclease YncB( thermonuclease family)